MNTSIEEVKRNIKARIRTIHTMFSKYEAEVKQLTKDTDILQVLEELKHIENGLSYNLSNVKYKNWSSTHIPKV